MYAYVHAIEREKLSKELRNEIFSSRSGAGVTLGLHSGDLNEGKKKKKKKRKETIPDKSTHFLRKRLSCLFSHPDENWFGKRFWSDIHNKPRL